MALGSAPLTSLSATLSAPSRPKTWTREVLATVGVPPDAVTAPPLTRTVPAASRLTMMVLARLSPLTLRTPELNEAVVAACAEAPVAARAPAASRAPASARRRLARRMRVGEVMAVQCRARPVTLGRPWVNSRHGEGEPGPRGGVRARGARRLRRTHRLARHELGRRRPQPGLPTSSCRFAR